MQLTQLKSWMAQAGDKPLVLGYGSLMSSDSRQRFSNIHHPGLMVTVSGYCRAWITRSQQEKQTYVGALPQASACLNAQLMAVNMDPALAEREKDYQFERVAANNISSTLCSASASLLHDWLSQRPVYICRSLASHIPAAEFPVHRTYVDTCMAGCLEADGVEAARHFVLQTKHWNEHLIDDRDAPKYPRAAHVPSEQRAIIDSILEALL